MAILLLGMGLLLRIYGLGRVMGTGRVGCEGIDYLPLHPYGQAYVPLGPGRND